jgi:hypothetical protein
MNNLSSIPWRYDHRMAIEVWLRKRKSPRLRVWLDTYHECLIIQLDCKYNYLHSREVISFDEIARVGQGWSGLVAKRIHMQRCDMRERISDMYRDSDQSRWNTYRAWALYKNMERIK